MSQLSADQTQGNELPAGDTSNKPNVLDNADHYTSNNTSTKFGVFNDKVQTEVARFQNAVETVNDAVCTLAKTFRQHGDMVQIVDERWERYQELEEEIRELRAGTKEMWRHREEDARRAKGLEEEAHAGEKERLHFLSLSTHLKDDYAKKEQKLKQKFEEEVRQAREEFEKTKTQLETDNAEKITALEKQKMELENANTKLKQDLEGKEEELEVEKESDKRLQESLRQDIALLKGKLNDIDAKYAVEEQSLEYYADRFEALVNAVEQVSTSYFTDLPERAREDLVGTSERLKKRAADILQTSLFESDCSQIVRLASIQHIIFEVIFNKIWQPFFSIHLWKHNGTRSILEDLYVRLAADGDQVQRNWKVSTLKVLDQLDATSDSLQLMDFLTDEVIETVRPLLDERQVTQFRTELRQLFTKAVELGKMVERDRFPVQFSREPSSSDADGWREHSQGLYEANESDLPSSPTESQVPLCVTPKIYRAATETTPERLIRAGSALFPRTGIFQECLSEWQQMRNAVREATKSLSKSRKLSTSSTMVTPLWSGRGLPLYGQ